MNTGKLQRRWAEEMPQVYNKETRIVCLDIKAEKHINEEGSEVDGYSFIQVEIDRQMDYGHIKSQLIESGFAQKDEFGLLMNAVDGIINAVECADSWKSFKTAIDTEDIKAFGEFCQFRAMCAETAKIVMSYYQIV